MTGSWELRHALKDPDPPFLGASLRAMETQDWQRVVSAGAYSVSQVCRILRPDMTPRKVHYWLEAELLGGPLRKGAKGIPTLLTFEQLLKVRTLQYLRDELDFSLQRVRTGLAWIVESLTKDDWHRLSFFRAEGGEMGVTDGMDQFRIGGQGIFKNALPELLTEHLLKARRDWERKAVDIEGFPKLISDAEVQGGAPIVINTRVETAFLAHLANEMSIEELKETYSLEETAVKQALEFENVPYAA